MHRDQPARSASPEDVYALLRRIRPLHRTLVRIVEVHLADTDLTRPMRGVLEQIHDRGPQTVPQLSRSLGVKRQFAQRVVNDLLAAGLAERRPNTAHRRSWLIAPTAAGTRVFGELRQREWHQLRQVAARMGREEITRVIDVLDRLSMEARAFLVANEGSESREQGAPPAPHRQDGN